MREQSTSTCLPPIKSDHEKPLKRSMVPNGLQFTHRFPGERLGIAESIHVRTLVVEKITRRRCDTQAIGRRAPCRFAGHVGRIQSEIAVAGRVDADPRLDAFKRTCAFDPRETGAMRFRFGDRRASVERSDRRSSTSSDGPPQPAATLWIARRAVIRDATLVLDDRKTGRRVGRPTAWTPPRAQTQRVRGRSIAGAAGWRAQARVPCEYR